MFIASVPCKQWFLQAGCYDTKGEKPLEEPFAFPLSMGVHVMPTSNGITSSFFAGKIRDLNIQQQDGNENINETIGLISKTTTLYVYHAFLCIFWPILYENV